MSPGWRCCNIMAMAKAKERHFTNQSRADYFSGGRLGGEEGAIIKDWGGRYPFALIYPNSYSVGMSNLGVQAIYRLLNSRSDAVCERVFWESDGKPLLSLESSRPMMDYACLAFSSLMNWIISIWPPSLKRRACLCIRKSETRIIQYLLQGDHVSQPILCLYHHFSTRCASARPR